MQIRELKITDYNDVSSSTSHQTKDHLQDAEHYHIPVMRMHNANLHSWGIAGGLIVKKTGDSELTIEEGLAIDKEGRSIPLASIGQQRGNPGQAYIDNNDNVKPPHLSKLIEVPIKFPTIYFNDDGSYYLTIELFITNLTTREIEGDRIPEGSSYRIIRRPLIRMYSTDNFSSSNQYGLSIILAKVTIANGIIGELSGADRQLANIGVREIFFKQGGYLPNSTHTDIGDNVWGKIGWKGLFFNNYYDPKVNKSKRLNDGFSCYQLFDPKSGALSIATGGDGKKDEDVELLERMTILNNGNVGIGTTAPLYRLHVTNSGGFGSENSDGTAQAGNVPLVLQSDSTVFGILNSHSRQAFALNIEGNNGTTSARGYPVFYDKYDGSWHPSIYLRNGNVGIGTTELKAKLQVNGDAYINGNTIVGAGGNGFIKVRHINGKDYVNDNDAGLFLNWSTAQPVYVGGQGGDGKPCALIVTGSIGIGTTGSDAKLDVNGFTRSLGVSVNDGTNSGVGRGLWLWHPTDPNHVIYSASPSGKSPADKPAVKGYFDSNHRLRIRTCIGQGFLFENNLETALVDIDSTNGKFWTKGAIYAGNSDIYFTNVDHRHSGFGNTAGYAAIENAADYGALMILGRQTPQGRIVKLWDRLEVYGSQKITGNLGTNGFNPDTEFPQWSGGGIYTHDLYARGAVYCGTGGESINIALYGNGTAEKIGSAYWKVKSDVRLKKDIKPLKESLNRMLKLRGVTFRWKEPEKFGNSICEQMGLIAQEAEEVFPVWGTTFRDGYKGLEIKGFEALTVEAFRDLNAMNNELMTKNKELEDRVKALEKKINAL
ncbi:MAG: tail fiber domain-containing protein [Candidatus Jettenia caeni]|nr:MAG: tail fiber domain-containing protein [Candidatus Jettenia caeni]